MALDLDVGSALDDWKYGKPGVTWDDEGVLALLLVLLIMLIFQGAVFENEPPAFQVNTEVQLTARTRTARRVKQTHAVRIAFEHFMDLLVPTAHAQAITPMRDTRTVLMTLTLYDTSDAVVQACAALGVPEARLLAGREGQVGCNIVYLDRTPIECHVHATRPRYVDDGRTTTIGHETEHCFIGSYHP